VTPDRRTADVKLRVLYVVIVIYAIVIGFPSTRAAEQSRSNCVATRTSAVKFNAALDAIVANSLTSNTLTPQQKLQRLQQYGPLHEFVPRSCPGAWPWEH
jgi:hypothetical protein